MSEEISKIPVIYLVFEVLSFFIMITTPPLNTTVINFATVLDIIGLVISIISLFNPNCKKVCAVLAIAFCITTFTVKFNLDNRRNNSTIYDYSTYRDPILDINSYFPNITTPSNINSSLQSDSVVSNATNSSSQSESTTSNNTTSEQVE